MSDEATALRTSPYPRDEVSDSVLRDVLQTLNGLTFVVVAVVRSRGADAKHVVKFAQSADAQAGARMGGVFHFLT